MLFLQFFKALHIVGFVAWFAGLFYLVRLFVYHAEAEDMSDPDKTILKRQYSIMENRLYRIICNPAMMITWTAGLVMLGLGIFRDDVVNYLSVDVGTPGWMHLKLLLVLLLTGYHLWSKRAMKKLEKGENPYSPWQFRLLNEGPTLFLVAISFLAVYGIRGTLNYVYLLIGLAVFSALLYMGAQAYRRRREMH